MVAAAAAGALAVLAACSPAVRPGPTTEPEVDLAADDTRLMVRARQRWSGEIARSVLTLYLGSLLLAAVLSLWTSPGASAAAVEAALAGRLAYPAWDPSLGIGSDALATTLVLGCFAGVATLSVAGAVYARSTEALVGELGEAGATRVAATMKTFETTALGLACLAVMASGTRAHSAPFLAAVLSLVAVGALVCARAAPGPHGGLSHPLEVMEGQLDARGAERLDGWDGTGTSRRPRRWRATALSVELRRALTALCLTLRYRAAPYLTVPALCAAVFVGVVLLGILAQVLTTGPVSAAAAKDLTGILLLAVAGIMIWSTLTELLVRACWIAWARTTRVTSVVLIGLAVLWCGVWMALALEPLPLRSVHLLPAFILIVYAVVPVVTSGVVVVLAARGGRGPGVIAIRGAAQVLRRRIENVHPSGRDDRSAATCWRRTASRSGPSTVSRPPVGARPTSAARARTAPPGASGVRTG